MTEDEFFISMTDGKLDPWTVITVRGERLLGRAAPGVWFLSSPIVQIDPETRLLASTRDGSLFALGEKLAPEEIPDEALIGFLSAFNALRE